MQTKDSIRFIKPTSEIWSDTQKLLSKRLKYASHQILQSAANLTEFNNGEAVLCVTNAWVRDRIVAECFEDLRRALCEVVGAEVQLKLVIDESALKQYTGTLASVTPESSPTPNALRPAGFQQPVEAAMQQPCAGRKQFIDGGVPDFLEEDGKELATRSEEPAPQEDYVDDVLQFVAEFEATVPQESPSLVPTPLTVTSPSNVPSKNRTGNRTQQTAVDRALAMAQRLNPETDQQKLGAAARTASAESELATIPKVPGQARRPMPQEVADAQQRLFQTTQLQPNSQPQLVPNSFQSGANADSTPAQPVTNSSQNQHFPPSIYQRKPAPAPASFDRTTRSNLNPKLTFETFVIGPHNSFGHSAAKAVAKNPGQAYNPLFIYGGVGLGKTHLMQSIGNQILSQFPNATVRYISCEIFTNEMITAIREDRMPAFRARYRQVDVLLVDDIHFIEKKESTQEEFFHTFNALRDSGKQIVISADRPPKAFAHLAERLRSRFEWGLICDVQIPDFETRLAILQKKCMSERIAIDASALEYIASVFTTNIRELEGALIKANAYSNLTGKVLDRYSLANILQPSGTLLQPKPVLTIDKIIATVAEAYKVEAGEIRSANRSQDLTLPRHIAMYLALELMQVSTPRVGQAFDNRKHSSVIYAQKRVKELIKNDATVQASVATLKRQLGH